MPFYDYDIETTNTTASGTIEATSEDEAREKLIGIHVPTEHGFVDEDNKPVNHELVNIHLSEHIL